MSKNNKSTPIKLIVNPKAGSASDTARNLKLVTRYLKKNGLKAEISLARPKAKATLLARQAVKDGYKIVVAMGGDGTVEAVMRGVVGSRARVGIVPAGMENNIAKSLGIPLNLEDACALIASDNFYKLDVGQVKTANGKIFSFFEMVGIGLSSAMYPGGTKAVGRDLSGIPVADQAQEPTPQESKSKVFLNLDDERIIEAETYLVMVTNTPVFGKKFLVSTIPVLQDGLLDISVFQDFGKDDLRGYYASMLNGGYSGNGKVQRYHARKLKVKSTPKAPIMADGIELGKGIVTIKILPGALRVIAEKKNPGLEIAPEEETRTLIAPVSPTIEESTKTEVSPS